MSVSGAPFLTRANIAGDPSFSTSSSNIFNDLFVTGTATIADTSITSLQATSGVVGNLEVTNLQISGDFGYSGNFDVGGNLFVNGNATIGTELDPTDLLVYGDTHMVNSLVIDENINAVNGVFTNISVSNTGSFDIVNSDEVTAGSVTVSDSLSVNVTLSVDPGSVEVTGDLLITGSMEMVGDLDIVGVTSTQGNLDVEGAVEIIGDFNVLGLTFLTGDVSIIGNVSIVGIVEGTLDISGSNGIQTSVGNTVTPAQLEVLTDPGVHLGGIFLRPAVPLVPIGLGVTGTGGDVTIGDNSAGSFQAITVGRNCSTGVRGIAIGTNAHTGDEGFSIGKNTNTGAEGMAIGNNSSAQTHSVSIGIVASDGGNGECVMIGYQTNSAAPYCCAVGTEASTGDLYANALGYLSKSDFHHSTAIGSNTETTETSQIMLGTVSDHVTIPNYADIDTPPIACTVTGISGTGNCFMPFRGNAYKKVILSITTLQGVCQVTFPEPFTLPPVLAAFSSTVAPSDITVLNTTSIIITIAGISKTGIYILEGL